MARYRYLAADLMTGVVRDELPLSAVRYSDTYNRPGAFEGRIGLTEPKATRANIDPARTVIYVERDGIIQRGYILWLARPEGHDTLLLAGEGIWSYFRRRLIRHTRRYSQVDQFEIVRDLINYAQQQPGGNIGVQLDETQSSGILRDQTWLAEERKNIGEAIEQLAARINGFGFSVESSWADGEIVNRLVLGFPRLGRRTRIVLEHGRNATILPYIDATETANLVDAIGAGEGPSMLIATAADPNVLGTWPLLETDIAHKDVTIMSTLVSHAESVLAARRIPRYAAAEAVVHPRADIQVGSWRVGDDVQVIVDRGWAQLSGWCRIVEWSVTIDDANTETIQMTFAATDAFAA